MTCWPAPEFTEYGAETAGLGYHTIKAERDAEGWTLALAFTPWAPGAACTEVATRRVARQLVRHPFDGEIEVRPSGAAADMARELLGPAWTVRDGGRGYSVTLR